VASIKETFKHSFSLMQFIVIALFGCGVEDFCKGFGGD
jgi:hypothetical protein